MDSIENKDVKTPENIEPPGDAPPSPAAIRSMQGGDADGSDWVDRGIVDVPVKDLPMPEGVSGPEDFNHHISWEDAKSAAERLQAEALAVADAGASLLVLEGVPAALAAQITQASPIPTIGIGAGAGCDGQVLVLHDLLGIDTGHRKPKFVKDFLAEGGSIAGAVRAFVEAVRAGRFPDAEHSYT